MFLNKKVKKCATVLGTAVVLAATMVNPASAQTFEQLYNNTITTQLFSFADFMSAIAYLAGIGFGIKAALKLKDWNESKGRDATLTQALIPLVIAGMLLGLPTVLKVARDSTTGQGVQGTSIGGNTGIRNIQ